MNLADGYAIAWISGLVTVRDALVAGASQDRQATRVARRKDEGSRVAFFKIYSTTPTEIILGEDDKHLDFRLSVLCSGEPSPTGKRHLTMSTVVHCHNSFGRFYLRLIAPFHRLVVQASLLRAARVGWPLASPSAD